jgi:hypothetical protein
VPGTWTDELLDGMRGAGDPVVDAAISEVYTLGQEQPVRDILHDFDENDDAVPAGLPPLLTAYFEQAAELPAWADLDRLEHAGEVFGLYAPEVVTCLFCYSLPICYACANGAQVLFRSQRLTNTVGIRIGETAQFVIDVMQPHTFSPEGRGRRSTQKIRLLHATIRHHLSQAEDWRPQWGLPINQEDFAGTLGSFSTAVILGLDRLGIELSPSERDDYFHLWRVVGEMLGLDERLNPDNFDDGKLLLDRILARQWASSDAGRTIAAALVKFMQDRVPVLGGLPASLVRHLAGEECADILGIDRANWTELGIELASEAAWLLKRLTGENPVEAKLASELGRFMLDAGLRASNMGGRFVWRVPTGLTDQPAQAPGGAA